MHKVHDLTHVPMSDPKEPQHALVPCVEPNEILLSVKMHGMTGIQQLFAAFFMHLWFDQVESLKVNILQESW